MVLSGFGSKNNSTGFFMLGVLMFRGSFISSKTSLLSSLNSILWMFYCENCWFHSGVGVFWNMDLNS